MAKKQSLENLTKIIGEVSSEDVHMFFRDGFALCCYLMEGGEERAEKKSLSYLFPSYVK